MKNCRHIILTLLVLVSSSCIEIDQVLKINKDLSGTITQKLKISEKAWAFLHSNKLFVNPLRQKNWVFPLNEADLKKLETDKITISDASFKKDGESRIISYTINFKNLYNFASSKASGLCRFQILQSEKTNYAMLIKPLASDYLDRRLPRANDQDLINTFEKYGDSFKGLNYKFKLDIPWQTKSKKEWNWTSENLTLDTIMNEDYSLKFPVLEFSTKDALKKKIIVSPESNYSIIPDKLLSATVDRFTVAENGDYYQGLLKLRVRFKEGITPIRCSFIQATSLISDAPAGPKDLVVPLPAPYIYMREIWTSQRLLRDKRFICKLPFRTRYQFNEIKELKAYFLIETETDILKKDIPVLNEWEDGKHSLEIEKVPVLFSLVEKKLEIIIPKKLWSTYKTIEIRNEGGRSIRTRFERVIDEQGLHLSCELNDTNVKITYISSVNPETYLVPLYIKNLKNARPYPNVNIGLEAYNTFIPAQIVDMKEMGLNSIALFSKRLFATDKNVKLVELDPESMKVINSYKDISAKSVKSTKTQIFVKDGVKIIRLNTETMKEEKAYEQEKVITDFVLSEKYIYTIAENKISQFNIADGKIKALKSSEKTLRAIALSVNGDALYTGGLDKKLYIHAIKEASYSTHEAHTFGIRSIEIMPEKNILLSGGDDLNIFVWDLKTKKPLKKLRGHESFVTKIVRLSDTLFVSGDLSGHIILWDLDTQGKIGSYSLKDDAIIDIEVIDKKIYVLSKKSKLVIFNW
ncbi:MAG: hypothetical protein HRT89_18645 [Lentisphaeria bacterium]|nr:hypothetical protein [Lentisphaeria bacterium]NQZ70077.1 hypothetical protein [Lentisphaeria bacterium]